MVLEAVNGDIYGTSVGINPNDGDTLCYPNHVGYSSDFNVMVNMGGACGDSSWVTSEDVPMISFHAPTDPFAPYNIGTVIVPGFNLPVVEVSGSYHVQQMAAAFGLNSSFAGADALGDSYTVQANAFNNGYTGLYPLNRPAGSEADSAPWDWWTADNPNNSNGLLTNPDMSEMKGMTYLDTIQGYAAPRIMCALDLAGSPCDPNSVLETEVSMKVFPNPSQGLFSIQLGNQETIRLMEVFDMMGKRVLTFNPNASFTTIDLTSVPNGMFTIRMKTDGAVLSTRVQKM
ncbi:MAG: T9SS type A sorting domain-containing protein [Flavobacteriales bacterium]